MIPFPFSGRRACALIFLWLGAALGSSPSAAEAAAAKKTRGKPTFPTDVAAWVEPNFPFFSSVLDARKEATGVTSRNLTPRGVILNLGQECWACFDLDLLRISAVWRGKGVSPKALAPGSYIDLTRKTNGGQTDLPEPVGNIWVANGIYPGWQTGAQLSLDDPREPAPSPEEIGRGPIPEAMGRFGALRLMRDAVVLEYTAGGAAIREQMTVSNAGEGLVIERRIEVGLSTRELRLVLGQKKPMVSFALVVPPKESTGIAIGEEGDLCTVRIAAHAKPVAFVVGMTAGAIPAQVVVRPLPTELPAQRWTGEVTTVIKRSTEKAAYVVDEIALPSENPWHRRVRSGDIQFLTDGTGVLITLDGDVWLVRGLDAPEGKPRWRRFASGLHEPMSLAIRNDEIFAFDKNGIWRLRDTNGDGEADVYEMFSNCFGQTAETREFPATIRLAPGGEFVIAKGGQEATYKGKHNGSVLRISADGRRATVEGYGFRQPSVGVNIRTGLITSSDQEGPYIPTTPVQIVRDHRFYGFLAPFQPKEVYPSPPAEPLVWIPHSVNPSGISQVWLFGAKMGLLNDHLIHIGFNQPEIFLVDLNGRTQRSQATVVSITHDFKFPPLNGSVDPADGQLYIAGFQVLGWGNVIDVPQGLGRVRFTGAPVTLPREVVPMTEGVLVRFDVALDPKKARDPANYALQSWGYQRTYKYGSAQYKADGTAGQDALIASSAYLSKDGRSVFVGVPGMKPVQQLRVGWALATAEGAAFADNAYTTPYELAVFHPKSEGFDDVTVDLHPRAAIVTDTGPISGEEGKRLAHLFACVACHAEVGNEVAARAGPLWRGLYGVEREVFIEGKATTVLVNDAYIRESILNPSAKIAAGFEKGETAMPNFSGVLNDAQVQSLILYIKSLK